MDRMASVYEQRLADYAKRLRRLHNAVRPLLPEAQQDELLELAIGVQLLAPAMTRDTGSCWCGHSVGRHRNDPIVCLDCWHTPTPKPDSQIHEHPFQPDLGEQPSPMPVL